VRNTPLSLQNFRNLGNTYFSNSSRSSTMSLICIYGLQDSLNRKVIGYLNVEDINTRTFRFSPRETLVRALLVVVLEDSAIASPHISSLISYDKTGISYTYLNKGGNWYFSSEDMKSSGVIELPY